MFIHRHVSAIQHHPVLCCSLGGGLTHRHVPRAHERHEVTFCRIQTHIDFTVAKIIYRCALVSTVSPKSQKATSFTSMFVAISLTVLRHGNRGAVCHVGSTLNLGFKSARNINMAGMTLIGVNPIK